MRTIFLAAAFGACLMAQPNPNLPTIYVAGDSTANNKDHCGWGDPLADYFDPAKVNVVNRAIAGRSARTYFNEKRWDGVRASLKPGDWVLIEFGHNDGGAPDKPPFRGDVPGIGDETQDVTLPSGTVDTVHTFGWYMRRFIADTKAAGATPILLSPTVRNIWTDGHVERVMGHFSEWSAQVAKAEGVLFLDHANAIADRYEAMGEAAVKPLFPVDHTHTNQEGAKINASLVVAALKGAHSPLVAFLSQQGAAVPPYPSGGVITDPAALKLKTPANPNLPTLFLIGDSTVRNGRGDGSNGQWGWGEPLVDLFDTAKINVVNRAVGGLSSRTYLTLGHWDRVLSMLKPGDFVIMQFGHNDSGPLDDAARARGTIKGTGDESSEIDNPITKQHEVVHTYGWYLRKFIDDTKAKGATAIVCSPIPRKTWKDGKIARAQDYPVWARQVAEAEHVGFLDLHARISDKYDELGPEKVEPLFGDPHTHTSRAGVALNGQIVVEALKALPDNPLGKYMRQ